MVCSAVLASACTQFRDEGGASGADAAAEDAPSRSMADAADASSLPDVSTGDSSMPDAPTGDASLLDASTLDAAPEASFDAAQDAAPEAGLDALLSVPPSGPSCDPSQGDSTCTSIGETCRISSTTAGTCDTFTGGHEGGFPCTTSEDCDDTLQCYNGTCHVLCALGTTCTGGCACFAVGNDAVGLCCPGQ